MSTETRAGPIDHGPTVRLTREGWLWLLTVAVLLGVGIAKNINLLALLGYVMLAALALNALTVGRRLRRLEAHRHHDDLLFARTVCRVEVRLRNTSGRPCGAVWIESGREASGQAGWFFDRLEGDARQVCQGEVELPARGWFDWPAVVASSTYPFGFVRRRVPLGTPERVLVLPRPGKLVRERMRHHLRGADPHGERVHRRGWRHDAAQADFHGLRPFRPGDSPRWIHWRTSARRGELMVREFEDVPGDDLVLVLDTAGRPQAFEQAVELAASIVWEWCRRRSDRLMLAVAGIQAEVFDGLTGPEHARDLLRCLALVQPGGGDGTIVLDALRSAGPVRSALVVVSAGPSALPGVLEAGLGRPVTALDVSRQQEWDFYTPP